MFKYFILFSPVYLLAIIVFCIFYKTDTFLNYCKTEFIKFQTSLLLIIFALICFVFSLHSSVFSSYDKFNNIDNDNKYNWFNTYDILRFPFEQLNLNFNKDEFNSINFSSITKSKQDKYFYFFIDKTGSMDDKNKEEPSHVNLKNKLIDSIENFKDYPKNGKDLKELNLEDLMIFTIIEALYKNKNINPVITIDFYLGDDNYISLYDNEFKLDNNFSQFYNDYFARNPSYGSLTNTDFACVLDRMLKKNILNDDKKYCISIISDFIHEKKINHISYSQLSYSIRKLNQKLIEKLNLYKINSNNVEYYDINHTVNEFRQLSNNCDYYEVEDLYLMNNLDPYNYIGYSVLPSDIVNSKDISFYYPYPSNRLTRSSNGQVKFDDTCSYLSYLTLKDHSVFDNSIKCWYNIDNKYVKINEPVLLYKSNDIKKINFSFSSADLSNSNYFLEYYNLDNKVKFEFPIIFKEKLPTTSSLLLIFLYFIFILSAGFILFYFLLQFIKNEKHDAYIIEGLLLLFIIVLLVYGIYYFVFFVINSYRVLLFMNTQLCLTYIMGITIVLLFIFSSSKILLFNLNNEKK